MIAAHSTDQLRWVPHSDDGTWWRVHSPPNTFARSGYLMGYIRKFGDGDWRFTWGGIEWCGSYTTPRQAARRVEIHAITTGWLQ